jgi:6-phosphogluconolactonase/glucosamine-6-phosphate isomerase/deaminase
VEQESEVYHAPEARYFKTKGEFDEAVGKDFIDHANKATAKGGHFFVGLSHGISPAGAYQYIVDRYGKIQRPELIYYTFVNSPLKRQRDLIGVTDAGIFLKHLFRKGYINRSQILGSTMNRDNMAVFTKELNATVGVYLQKQGKEGLDYAFLASDTTGRVAGLTRKSPAFDSDDIVVLVKDGKEEEATVTPNFLLKTRRTVFLATKADKRRPLAWLYYKWGKDNESPSFLRYMDNVEQRMTVFIDDKALTWPQIEVKRKTPYGDSTIRLDLAKTYNENATKKVPVILMVHGFLGLNTFDGLLTAISSTRYIAAAMHYGSVPHDLPTKEYSKHVARNIDAVIAFFGDLGHDVYLFDHSMANIYFLMMDKNIDDYPGFKKYLRGRIGSNPFFGEEAKWAILGFMDNVLIPSVSMLSQPIEKALFFTMRRIIPIDSKRNVRERSISLTERLIKTESGAREQLWKEVRHRVTSLMSGMGALPHLDRIPIIQALNKIPAKIFGIQIYSALLESKAFDKQKGLHNMQQLNIPILILKSDKDVVAHFVERIYDDGYTEIRDVTNLGEKQPFREHLYFMINPRQVSQIVEAFISDAEEQRKGLS